MNKHRRLDMTPAMTHNVSCYSKGYEQPIYLPPGQGNLSYPVKSQPQPPKFRLDQEPWTARLRAGRAHS